MRPRKPETKENRKEKLLKKNRRKLSASNGTKSFHKVWSRLVVIFSLMIVVYFFYGKNKEKRFATADERDLVRFQNLTCSPEFSEDVAKFSKCAPLFCGRFVNDLIVDSKEAELLLDIAKRGLALAGSSGGASILDLHSGSLSKGKGFINVYNSTRAVNLFKDEHLLAYKNAKSKIRKAIAEQFRIKEKSLYLTFPSFFSKLTNVTAKTVHDEYWHPHVDKETYQAFHFTSLLYLTDYVKNFTGGRFIFMDKKANMTVEPVRGRVTGFTSGSENLHFVEKVTSGERYALTVSFTCNPKFAMIDPYLKYKARKEASTKSDNVAIPT